MGLVGGLVDPVEGLVGELGLAELDSVLVLSGAVVIPI
tara:strand:- start:239 stop:352 length:114 start_codon:yes stop_codon:yes gene_type:complete